MDGTGDLFAPILPLLQSKFPVFVVDYPVHRALDYDTLAADVLRRCPNNRFVLVAESFSGPIAALIAKHAPAQLIAVIFVCSFLRSPSRLGSSLRQFLRFAPRLRAPSWMTAIAVRRSLLNGCADERVVQAVVAAVERVDVRVASERLHALLDINTLPSPPARELAVAYLRARDDRLVGKDAWHDVQSVYPQAKCFELAGPHCLLQSRPAEAAAAIAGFVANLVSPPLTSDA